ncbi:AbrB/MazE/SpoVT family DNA-binding domain-containing protein [uncultured Agrobacterium sp.]|uniref:AbrB/MazE/SpoVT family DNA-binding domain-containing protein n=1 Tax=uncultured Agrobacterium sp. TaxID=157277 RepID=UPI00258B544E|nr:AbrB/MazE/SpoVT family DNA-binding domain-containing protein [uncultured Agrobacterium sp.]
MNVTVRKIGNSEGIIIPKEVLDRLGLKAGDVLNLNEDGQKLELTPEPSDLQEQLAAARRGMEKYKVALRELAK